MGPNECKYCGAGREKAVLATETFFACGSCIVYGDWGQSAECEKRSLRDRIQRALKRLETATRFDVIPWDGGVSRDPSDGGGEVDADVVDQVIEILRGNSPETPDSSPVTADQLAVADYFEAVRQQVPWMVTIEHIEGLVEGYRQCGVMVWQAAEQIEKVFRGGNGQTE